MCCVWCITMPLTKNTQQKYDLLQSYYDRLLEIAAGAKDEDASKPSSCSSGGGEQDSPVQEHGSEEGDTTPQASLLSPPKKPKGKLVRIAPLPESAKPSQKKNDVVRPVVSSVGTQKMDGKKKLQIAVPSEGSNTRKGPSAVAGPGLLRVPARGLKPMPAPWEGGQQTSSEDTPHHTMAAVTKSTSNKKSEQSTTSIAEQEKDPRDVLIEELQQKLNQMHEEAQVCDWYLVSLSSFPIQSPLLFAIGCGGLWHWIL